MFNKILLSIAAAMAAGAILLVAMRPKSPNPLAVPVADLKSVSAQSTYREFRDRELALLSAYEANKNQITNKRDVESLISLCQAVEFCWQQYIQAPDTIINPNSPGFLKPMATITSIITNKLDYSLSQMRADPDFYAKSYVRKGLAEVGLQCDIILDKVQLSQAR